jgi:predicted phage terminase large subunit-like protein
MQLLSSRYDYPEVIGSVLSLPSAQADATTREWAQKDLFFLLTYIMNRRDADKDWLFDRCREVQDAPNDMIDLWSREHYKSTIITFAKTIQDILNNPDITIGIFSHTRPIAKGFLRQIKREFELNDRLKRLFPDILYENPSKEAVKWSEDDGIIVKRKTNPKEATVEAWGVVDGQPTGKHFSLLVYDDIVTKESVTTPDMIEKTTDSLALSYNLGAHGGTRRFIGTRYHFSDTYNTIMDRGTAKPRIHAATHDGSMTGEPVFLTQEQLDNKRRDMGSYVFACQMLQSPTADSAQGFQRDWIKRFDSSVISGCNWYLLVDAANGKRKHNDYTAIWAVGLGQDGNYYCIPEVRDRINLTERAKRIIELHRKYKPVEVRYERYGMMSDIAYIKLVQEQVNYRFDIIEVAGATSKIDRIKRLVPLFETGKIYIPQEHYSTDYEGKARDLVNDFIEQEFIPFPVPLHDDMLDALARITDDEGTLYGQETKQVLELEWPNATAYVKPNNYKRNRGNGLFR